MRIPSVQILVHGISQFSSLANSLRGTKSDRQSMICSPAWKGGRTMPYLTFSMIPSVDLARYKLPCATGSVFGDIHVLCVSHFKSLKKVVFLDKLSPIWQFFFCNTIPFLVSTTQ